MDRDSLICGSFKEVLKTSGIEIVLLPPKSPNLNAYMERFIGTMRREVCSNYIPLDEHRLRNRLEQHVQFYNQERTHQSLHENMMPDSVAYDQDAHNKGPINCKSRIGDLLNYKNRDIA